MFGGDLFNDQQDYEATYRSYGGTNLKNSELHEIIYYTYGQLLERSRDKAFQDDMITVEEFIKIDPFFVNYTSNDNVLIERVFAHHEFGSVPETCKQTMHKLSKTHRLCVISNVWCKSSYFIDQLKKDSVFELFELIIYSSDHRTVKPSPKIFNLAIEHFQVPKSKVVHIGDNYKRDVLGAKKSGITSILVHNSEAGKVTGDIKPDVIINQIEDLVF
jgi:FMN phosphatase YigB (HAD superfamily)